MHPETRSNSHKEVGLFGFAVGDRSLSSWFFALAVLAVAWVLVLVVEPETARVLVEEDGPYEYAGAALFFLAGILFIATWRSPGIRSRGFPWLLLLGMLMLFTAGEEISWGQRILGWSTPEGLNNVQGETNIHNLPLFDFTSAGLLSMNALFEMFCLSFGVLLPLAVRFSAPIARLVERLRIPLVPLAFGIFFPLNFVLSKLYQRLFDEEWLLRIAEVREATHALVMFVIALGFWQMARRRSAV